MRRRNNVPSAEPTYPACLPDYLRANKIDASKLYTIRPGSNGISPQHIQLINLAVVSVLYPCLFGPE